MKKKISFTFFAVIILNIIPLLPKPELILNFKTGILIISAIVLWLSQPAFSTTDMNKHKENDKLSLLFILVASCISVFSSVAEWAYFTENKSEVNFITITGIFFLVAGIILRVWSINILGKHFTATVKVTKEHELIKIGPYRYIRHPSYLGALIAITGCPLFLNNSFTILISFTVMLLAYYFRITFEEKALSAHFGQFYEEYKKNTCRLLPLIW
jgi:protein-S-isoprenylcysteine O-methyltransferase Ste14